MAKLTSLIQFSGSLDGISVFKMESVDRPMVRRKCGASREKILTDACFENTRRNMGEFGGRGTTSHYVLETVQPLRPGLRTTGQINKILRAVQKLDTGAKWGARAVALSRCPDLLQGVNCGHPKIHPYFRVVAVLGAVPDVVYHPELDTWGPRRALSPCRRRLSKHPGARRTAPPGCAATLEIVLPAHPGVEGFSLLLSGAVQYGKLGVTGDVEPLPKAVASRVLAVG